MEKINKNWLYRFEAVEVIKKENGETIKNNRKFCILKPNRRLREDGELFYAAETSRFAKAGVLPRAAWNTILSNGGGSISDKEREVYGELLLKFRDASLELQSILFKTEDQRSEAEKTRTNELTEELDDIRKEIQSFESSQIAIFENTAEAKARNRTILWWVLNLAHEEMGDKYEEVVKGESFNEKLDFYDNLENIDNEFLLTILRRFTYLITVWFLGKAETEEDFKYFDDLNSENKKSKIVKSEETSEEKQEEIIVETNTSESKDSETDSPTVAS
jgi:hypothetical protein